MCELLVNHRQPWKLPLHKQITYHWHFTLQHLIFPNHLTKTFDDLKKKDLLWSIQFSILSIRKASWQKYRPLKSTLQDFYFSDKKYSDYGFFFLFWFQIWDSLIHISRIDFTGLIFFTFVIKSKGKTKENRYSCKHWSLQYSMFS